MTKTAVFVAIVLLALFVLAALVKARTPTGRRSPISARIPLTKREQSMHFRLASTFPERVVLAQVAFSALLKTSSRATRNTFDRKVADFVLCDRAFSVLAVIELDDSSHAGRNRQDGARDQLLIEAGYRVLRYAQVPDSDRLLQDFNLPDKAATSPATG